ncbi:insulin receptor substrate 4 [Tachyglossus aculeatus]|uniref:insulin receptor substrate 4 n=1 Tax=Tachyglossus aculeatus TaxID=9261 RepID=UPI0018F3B1DA|nr:insulin receptor substrate 4 [Tachyglossus aculeatus]
MGGSGGEESGGDPLPPAGEDVRKCGYLRKQKHGHKRYFVLRAASRLAPARLEYYESEKKFRSSLRASSSGQASGGPPKRVIPLYQCFTVSRRADAKHRHLIALYTKDDYFAMVADSEQEQESWFQALSRLMGQARGRPGPEEAGEDEAAEPPQPPGGDDDDDDEDGPSPGFKEVWQVQVKPKGLGHSKNLSGVYRLCLSSKAVQLVRLNAQAPCVQLQLLSIRRCGHSEHFFFLEVGRSASIGPGELWMQVDDSVVAQNMHETFLETMKALKAFAEFRPRSKSQSSGTNPISFLSTRRHLGHLPPSQAGLPRRPRTDGTPPNASANAAANAKSGAYRFRTSSEGEGTMARPFRSVTGSLMHLNAARLGLGRPEGPGGARSARAVLGGPQHARSASLPVAHLPAATSPVSVSPGSGPDPAPRPASASAACCGSPGDGGLASSDEYGSSPGDPRYLRVRSGTPDSLSNTPPIREEPGLGHYMAMGPRPAHRPGPGGEEPDPPREQQQQQQQQQQQHSHPRHPHPREHWLLLQQEPEPDGGFEADKGLRKRTYSLTRARTGPPAAPDDGPDPPRPRGIPAPEDGRDLQGRARAREEGYMPMLPGVAATPPPAGHGDYLPMAPRGVPAPRAWGGPWSPSPSSSPSSSSSSSQADSRGYVMMYPRAGSSPLRSPLTGPPPRGPGDKGRNSEYMDMSPGGSAAPRPAADGPGGPAHSLSRALSAYFSLPRSFKALSGQDDHSEYVPMASPGRLLGRGGPAAPPSPPPEEGPGPGRAARPTRLPLGPGGSHAGPGPYERATPPEPASPGDYINIDSSDKASPTPYSLSAEGSPSSLGSSGDARRSPLSDYMSVDLDVRSPRAGRGLSGSPADGPPYGAGPRPARSPPAAAADYARLAFGTTCASVAGGGGGGTDDYTEMTFNPAGTPPLPFAPQANGAVRGGDSPPSVVVGRYPGGPCFPGPRPEPPVGPKVIRADPQGRRRHSSETFSSSAGTGAPSSSSSSSSSFFTDGSKRHSSASFDNVWLKPEEGPADGQESKMSRDTSTGFQNGLNYIALNLREDSLNGEAGGPAVVAAAVPAAPTCHPLQNGTANLDSGAYVSIDFSRSDGLKCNSARKD